VKTRETIPQWTHFGRRKGAAALVTLLPNILMMIAIGASIFLAVQNGTPVDLADTVLSRVMEPMILIVEKVFAIIAPLTPILAAIIPLWMVFNDSNPATIEVLIWSAVYGVGLFALVLFAGIDIQIMSLIQGSWTGSIIGGALGLATSIGNILIGVLMGLTYWSAGFILELFVLLFEFITGLGHAAKSGARRARRTQGTILERLRGESK
jgi:hypothetical protein